MRILAKELIKSSNKKVRVAGWLHKKRALGGIMFILLRDRSGLIQVKLEDPKEEEKLRGMQIGTVLEVTGVVHKDERAPGGAEIHEPAVTVLVAVEDTPPIEVDKAIDHTPDNLDTLFENRVVNIRNPVEQGIFKIQAAVKEGIRSYLRGAEFIEFNSPKLLPGATEGGAEVFKLDHFDKQATLAQSAQFYKQIMVGAYERVFEINPTYRAEPSATTRHMSEFIHVDVEMGFINTLEELYLVATGTLHAAVEAAWQNCEAELKALGASRPKLKQKLPVITLSELHKKYSAHNKKNTKGEKDPTPDEERWVSEYSTKNFSCEAIYVNEFPASEMKFYHHKNAQNPEVADRADLIFRGVEIATLSLRENRYEKLLSQLKAINVDPNDPGYKYYLQAFKYGLPPHGGFGLGLERLTQKIIGLSNVKEATLFPRDMNRLAP